ncbi:type 1 fimbrial protein [Citrobacter rodentium NBRC 105723 = DSM 16636]|jgi:P pilus assembly protein, pilin FimA|uniref:Fimbrial subunit n=3 Tax=Citrobacter rodentium TaxID=67825 RepID=D2TQS9_CITRI|nr:fimbrial protein [Citrobacter rodentium]KIQ49788.1 fimbrial protein [Citrobacter rodentium]QBY29869.1 type 1 fimbrial protein [Citrobacter rodentium]UHO32742.1 type 1 fimbrial protein [Citrobacter rodentium NBRC 105723 = DSM 16636]CBG90215.1 putative fimbrial subunit [Citrobacter rodentium ICC168]HAT8014188.1 type 1 fimbrial protein [Citrobacter rodentium NBRC 105723 = DSM 16636]
MHRIMIFLASLLTPLCTAPAWAQGQLIGGDLSFKGVVVAYPCSIAPDSERIPVDFGKISTKSLSINGKTTPVPFTIKLQDCNPSVFHSVTVTFSGTENPNLADRLAISATAPGNAGGVGVGLLEADDTPVRLNVPTTPTTVSDTVLRLNFQAFVEAEPDALANGTLTTGPFTATANYTLNYQ